MPGLGGGRRIVKKEIEIDRFLANCKVKSMTHGRSWNAKAVSH